MKGEKKGIGIFGLTVLGIALNLLLCAVKFGAGAVSHSVTITADGWNSLTDAGTSAITMLGLWAAGCGAGRHHPFGHGRLEWILGMLTSASVITIGLELLKSSGSAVYQGQQSQYPGSVFIVLLLSVFVKIWMHFIQKRAGERWQSETLKAVSNDSLADALATSAVLISALAAEFTSWKIDGWCGVGVAALIIFNGVKSFSDIVQKVIGMQADSSIAEKIEEMIMQKKGIKSCYELMIHDYGLNHYVVSAKVLGTENTVCARASELSIEIEQKFGCGCTVQADIMAEESPEIQEIKKDLKEKAKEIHRLLNIHHFYLIKSGANILIMADISIPVSQQKKRELVYGELSRTVRQHGGQYQLRLHPVMGNNHVKAWKTSHQAEKRIKPD